MGRVSCSDRSGNSMIAVPFPNVEVVGDRAIARALLLEDAAVG